MTGIYDRVSREIENLQSQILELSHKIHAKPELAFQEFETSKLLLGRLQEEGFIVEKETGGLKTAFRAHWSNDPAGQKIIYTAEMDALPEIGHACGHNIIGCASVFAAIVLKRILGKDFKGTIEVVGTPAEENGNGKIDLIRAGLFSEEDVVLQMHPHSLDTVICQALLIKSFVLEYFGKTSHAAAAPHEGINALDAMVMFYQSVAVMRQQFPRGCLFHGVIDEGGIAPNLIPQYTKGRFALRADNEADGERVYAKILNCVEAAAKATGCQFNVTPGKKPVTTFKRNEPLEDLFSDLFDRRGRKNNRQFRTSYGSTDLANVSQICPTIEILIKASDAPIHTTEFAEAAVGNEGDKALLDGIFCLACAGSSLLTDKDVLRQVKNSF